MREMPRKKAIIPPISATNWNRNLETFHPNKCYLDEWLWPILYGCEVHAGHGKPKTRFFKFIFDSHWTWEQLRWEPRWRWESPATPVSPSLTDWRCSGTLCTWAEREKSKFKFESVEPQIFTVGRAFLFVRINQALSQQPDVRRAVCKSSWFWGRTSRRCVCR